MDETTTTTTPEAPPAAETYGASVRRRREAAGMTRLQLAARVGVSERCVRSWEAPDASTDQRSPGEPARRVIDQVLGSALASLARAKREAEESGAQGA